MEGPIGSKDEAEPLSSTFGGASSSMAGLMRELGHVDTLAPRAGEPQWSPPESFDEYRLVRPLGRGGMGQVFVAHDVLLDRAVAVKFIGASWQSAPELRERFLLEARALARLSHPNVVAVHRIGSVDGQLYIVSELVRGQPLSELPRPVPWREVCALLLGLARGLAAAHRAGVLHRDVKPSNAMRGDDGEVKLLDFGIAKVFGKREGAGEPLSRSSERAAQVPIDLTGSGAIIGTLPYMAPEVLAGEAASRRSDLYSLGVLAYELCADRLPRREGAAPLPSLALIAGVDARFAALIDRCLRVDPAERLGSADELLGALGALEVRDAVVEAGAENPYRGLRTFERAQRAFYFGRAAETRELVERVRVEPLVIVAGDSGVGKSSLCRAGVLPRLEEGALGDGRAWQTVRLWPGRRPLLALASALSPRVEVPEEALAAWLRTEPASLARALRKSGGQERGVLLLVDQLEELFTLASPEDAALCGEILGHLAMPSPGVRALFTVRGDYLTRLLALPGLGPEVSRCLYLLRPLERDALREVITAPAARRGVRFEGTALQDTLVEGALDGGLPLLSFALSELWTRRDAAAGVIHAESLDAIGGVAGALARHADTVVAQLPVQSREQVRQIMSRLVTPEGTRERRRADELRADEPATAAALEALVAGRILVARGGDGGVEYELAHEALVTGWSTLRDWLDADAGARQVLRRLESAAAEWERVGRAKEALWSERRLKETESLDLPSLPALESTFLRLSLRAASTARLRKWATVVAALLLPLLLYAGYRWKAAHDLGLGVEAKLELTTRLLGSATEAESAMDAKRDSALRLFRTAPSMKDGEAPWASALAAAKQADSKMLEAAQQLTAAMLLDPSRADLRDQMGDVIVRRIQLAQKLHQAEKSEELLRSLSGYDTQGRRLQRLTAPAMATITTTPSGATLTLHRYEEGRAAAGRNLGRTPLRTPIDTPGSYLLEANVPGRPPLRLPFVPKAAEALVFDLLIPTAAQLPDGLVYVPAGRFLFGSAETEDIRLWLLHAPMHEVSTKGFLIGKHEVTLGDWLKFVDSLPPTERSKRTPGVQRATSGFMELVRGADGVWTMTLQPTVRSFTARAGERFHYDGRKSRSDQNWLQFPVSAISVEDAKAYLAWLDTTGRVPGARLCTEHEWERAARGADGRVYPHGKDLSPDDANFDETYGLVPVAFGFDEVGSHPASDSPFGVKDLLGNVAEWVAPSLGSQGYILRGGSWYWDRVTSRSNNRQQAEATLRDLRDGLRVCANASFEK